MKRYTIVEKQNGELAIRDLSKKAQKYYYGADPLTVYEIETDEGVRYDIRGLFEYSNLTFDLLQKLFEDCQDELDKMCE